MPASVEGALPQYTERIQIIVSMHARGGSLWPEPDD